jgi:dTDP-4-dehydrorhamnose 3,5-epimerase-like enzyme
MEHGQFVGVNFDNADEMEITVPKGMIDGISMLNQGSEFTTIYTCGTSVVH